MTSHRRAGPETGRPSPGRHPDLWSRWRRTGPGDDRRRPYRFRLTGRRKSPRFAGNLLYDVDRTCSEPDDRMKHVLDTDPRTVGITLPPSSHAKAVDTFAPAKELELELRRVLRGEIRFDAGARAMYASDGSNYRQAPIGVVLPRDNDDVIAAMTACRKFGARSLVGLGYRYAFAAADHVPEILALKPIGLEGFE